MLKDSKPKINVVEKRWVGPLPFTFKLRWINIWCKMPSRKEAGFMWALWNKVIVVNTWRVKVDNSINQTCSLCSNEKKSTLHRFGSIAMHNELGSTKKALCVNLLMVTSRHGWLPPYIGNNEFCCQKSKASAACGEHMVLAKRYHTLDVVN